MRRVVSALLLLILFLGMTAGVVKVSVDKVSDYARKENQEKTALVQQRLDETISMLETLSQDPYICSSDVSFQDKAVSLTAKNKDEKLGYMMVRILDGDMNIYREDTGKASNLGSREYVQTLYATGERQVTDAFLAGADGETINYTVAVGIKEDGKVVSALMAAIYGFEIDALLQDADSVNVLVGSQLQYMGGIPEEQFGLAVAQVLESERRTSRPVENILLDFYEKRSGSFWGFGDGIQYFTYLPVENSDWVVMTEVSVMPMVGNVLMMEGLGILALAILAVLLFKRQQPKIKLK